MGLAVSTGCAPDDAPVDFDQSDARVTTERDSLEGRWDVVLFRGEYRSALIVTELAFERRVVDIRTDPGTGGPFNRLLVSVDPMQQPKWMDLKEYLPVDPSVYALPDNWTPKTFFAVYSIEEDGILRIHCSERPGYRPKDLTNDEGVDTWYAELKRRPPEPQRPRW